MPGRPGPGRPMLRPPPPPPPPTPIPIPILILGTACGSDPGADRRTLGTQRPPSRCVPFRQTGSFFFTGCLTQTPRAFSMVPSGQRHALSLSTLPPVQPGRDGGGARHSPAATVSGEQHVSPTRIMEGGQAPVAAGGGAVAVWAGS